ncbi:ATP-binding cassette domain-containing protein [Roseomonas haemaphysalidis]|uniref:ABC transporter ATP-binding protein n=1 Tax=Roseomonas haemaphysalidis TaxID=2768162 RepID=A0ABS3KNB4_9PROT|nr:ATP-binding cassette domain-containing protein [Roseomonas haemaphysalidis]MBO1078093.1 ABC transporter ATP-binding protein [Roseomonas haemaphysalidis]
MSAPPLLLLENITKRFELEKRMLPRLLGRRRPLLAVDDVTLAVPRGEVTGLVGESGCGKSTLARIMLRLEEPTDGRVVLGGTDLTALRGAALRPERRRMQMVFQDAGASLNPRKTGARLLDEALVLAGETPEGRAFRAAELMRQVGLDPGLLQRFPHELSGGQKQRLAIARALAMGPEVLVADEPVSALDVSLQSQIMRLLMELRDRLGLTMVFISHDLALVHHLCASVAVMSAGRIVEQGHPRDVLRDPQHPYTRRLLAAVPGSRRLAEQEQPA